MRRLIHIAVAAVMLTACSDEDPSGADEIQIVGSYQLETINGQAMPVPLILFPGAFLVEQRGGDIVIRDNGTTLERAFIRFYTNDPEAGVVFDDDTTLINGVWEAEDSVVVITTANDFSFGFVSGDRLTLSFELGDSLYTQIFRRTN
jgi:hypothetical protein